MPRSLLTQRRALALVVVLAVLCSMLPAGCSAKLTDRLSDVVHLPLMPFTNALHWFGARLHGPQPTAELGDTQRLANEYVEALAYQRQLEEALADAREQIAQLAQIRNHRVFTGYSLQPAAVVAGSDYTSPTITINRGTRHGVQPNQPVAFGTNLVGRVTDVGPTSATVTLITAPGSRLDVRFIPPQAGPAPLGDDGQLELFEGGPQFFCILDMTSPVQEGDLAYLSDERWPIEARGLFVGQVVTVEKAPDDPTLRKRVIVKPIPSLRHLTRVVVFVPIEAE